MRIRRCGQLVLAVSLLVSVQQIFGDITFSGPRMTVARESHSATLLTNGSVLVAGGTGTGGATLSSAELLDTTRSSWVATGSLHAGRSGHTATLLPTGKVFVAGGLPDCTTGELWDPKTGLWTEVSGLPSGLQDHTATLLEDGSVLLAAGGTSWRVRPEAFSIDAATMVEDRRGHAAGRLRDGRVFVVGGKDGSGDPIDTSEIYDPDTGVWTAASRSTNDRWKGTLTVLADGRVLVAGGVSSTNPWFELQDSTQVWNPTEDSWDSTATWPSPPTLRWGQTATLLPDDRVLICGGQPDETGHEGVISLSSCDLYTPDVDPPDVRGTWTSSIDMRVPRANHVATLLPEGVVLVTGGRYLGEEGLPTNGTELIHIGDVEEGTLLDVPNVFDCPTSGNTLTLLPDGRVLASDANGTKLLSFSPTVVCTATNSPNFHPGSATLLPDGNVLAVDGFDEYGSGLASVFDPSAESWTSVQSMAVPRYGHRAVLLGDGRVLVVGGSSSLRVYPSGTETFDPVSETWSSSGSLALGREWPSVIRLRDGRVLVVGGQRMSSPTDPGSVVDSAEVFDPRTGVWQVIGGPTVPRVGASFSLLPSGRVLLAGGETPVGTKSKATEIFDPEAGTWTEGPDLLSARSFHEAVTLPNGHILFMGGALAAHELLDPWANGPSRTAVSSQSWDGKGQSLLLLDGSALACGAGWDRVAMGSIEEARRPAILNVPDWFDYSSEPASGVRVPLNVLGSNVAGVSEGSGGGGSSSAVDLPVVQLQSLVNADTRWLLADPLGETIPGSFDTFHTDPVQLSFTDVPDLDPGYYRVTILTAGIPSVSSVTEIQCGVSITTQPTDALVAPGEIASFEVVAYGARSFQWQKAIDSPTPEWQDIPGANEATYATPPVAGQESGLTFRVRVTGNCGTIESDTVTLTVEDQSPPEVAVLSPSGGEFWLLSTAEVPQSQLVTWSMTDDVRICQASVRLLYSDDGGGSWSEAAAGGGLPQSFGSGGSCAAPGVSTSSVEYTIPTEFPSGHSGSLYKVEVVVRDAIGNETTARSSNPFYIVRANPDSVKTLILADIPRMENRQGITQQDAAQILAKLHELAGHPRVQGVVIDLSSVSSIQDLFAAWDADPSNPDRANDVLFGEGGLHSYLRTSLLAAYSGVEYVVLVGDDRIIPMSRIDDRTVLLPEATYADGTSLTTASTVGQALAAGTYLSDDPIVVLDPVSTGDLTGSLFLPDLSIGRLVETPQEIITTIAAYIGQDGVLDLSTMDPSTGHKVLVTGYDFLNNAAMQIRRRWKGALEISTPNESTAPVNGSLVGGDWELPSVAQRTDALRGALSGNGGDRYGVMAISGHATHFEEGVPGTNPYDINGLSTADIYGADSCSTPSAGALDLSGGVIYAVGCHGGLAVPGSCRTDADHSLDLPQTFLARGVVAYVANTGYGWGLKYGIGYGSRLTQIFTEQITSGGTVAVGDLVRQSKLRYFLESPRYDAYDEKSLMQWTLYGLPMYAVRTGIAEGAGKAASDVGRGTWGVDGGRRTEDGEESVGAVKVTRALVDEASNAAAKTSGLTASALPSYLTQLNLSFDFTGEGVYDKHDSTGAVLDPGPGCLDPNGCYYTLNGLVDRGTGSGDLPIQPYLIYDSRLSGTSQHGVLWKGGTYDEESDWKPVIAELVSNSGYEWKSVPYPRTIGLRPTAPRVVPGVDSPTCRPSELEVNSLTLTAGEAVKPQTGDLEYTIARRYRTMDVEVFYYNNRTTPTNNCDRTGPELGAGPYSGGAYHQLSDTTLNWAVPVSDTAGVWRVVVVYNLNTVDGNQRGAWTPLELASDGEGVFHGSILTGGGLRLTYVVQAIDNRGNVTWFDFVSEELPSSGVPLGLPDTVDVDVPEQPLPGLFVDDVTVLEGKDGTVEAVFTVTLSAATVSPVTVDAATADVTAKAGADYTALGTTTLMFNPGETTKQVVVVVIGDVIDELDETFVVNLSSPTNAFLGDPQGTGTITDDDATTISIADAAVTEGNSGTVNALFEVTLSTPSARTVDVTYGTADGTAIAGSDYTATTGVILVFEPGDTTRQISIPVSGDLIDEKDETFVVNLSLPANATLSDAQGIGTIQNDDTAVISIADAVVTEGNSGSVNALFHVTLTTPADRSITVDFATSNGTATGGVDFTAVTGATLTFDPGVTTTNATVVILGDVIDEADETFSVVLSNASGGVLQDAQATGTITDDDSATLSISDVTVPEGDSGTAGAQFTVTLSTPSATTVGVQYSTADGTALAGYDYASTGPTALVFSPGQTSKTVSIGVIGDVLDESDETFVVNLANASNASIADAQGIATITDDDSSTISISDAAAVEGNSGSASARFVVSLSGPSASTVSVDYATANGTAVAGSDYNAVSTTTLTFEPGETTRNVLVTVTGDPIDESDETFVVNLTNAVNASIADAQGTGTILDDDSAELSIDDVTVAEGNSGTVNALFTVSLSTPSASTVTVQYTTADGTATAGSDYTAIESSTLTFNAGETTKTIAVVIAGDVVDEANETYTVTLSNAVNASILDGVGAGTIADDDSAVLSIGDVTVTEGDVGSVPAQFTVILSTPSAATVTVQYATADGTATAGSDYTAIGLTTLTFDPGQTSKTFNVTVLGDLVDEGNETFAVNLTNATNAAVVDASGVGTITNDDVAAFLIDDVIVAEGDSGTTEAQFTVSLSTPSAFTVTVEYATSNATAVSESDYTGISTTTLTFVPGETSKTVSVSVIGDVIDEANEVFRVNLSNSANAAIADPQGAATITDDDTSSISIDDVSVTEGDSGTVTAEFTVSLSTPSASTVTVRYATADGSAVAGSDYTAVAATTLTFTPGETAKTVTVAVIGDVDDESDETFVVNLFNAVNAELADGQGIATITDDDSCEMQTWYVDLDMDGYGGPQTTESCTQPNGYVADGGDCNDNDPEVYPGAPEVLDEKDNDCNGQIDDVPAISIGDATVTEGNADTVAAQFSVTLSKSSLATITVQYATADVTATAGADYAAVGATTVTFDPGETSKNVTLLVTGDTVDELDETFVVNLSDATNATIADAQGIGTIVDDDVPSLSISDATVSEGDTGTVDAQFTVTLSMVAAATVTVDYATADGTATAGSDYTAVGTTTLTFDPGETSKSVAVTVMGDVDDEADETFVVNLFNAVNADIGDNQGTGTIEDDDDCEMQTWYRDVDQDGHGVMTDTVQACTQPDGYAATFDDCNDQDPTIHPGAIEVLDGKDNDCNGQIDDVPVISIGDATVTEGNEGTVAAQFTVTLSKSSSASITVQYATADMTATAGSDYTAVGATTLTFAPGETSKTVTVLVTGDTVDELDETFVVNLSNTPNATIADGQGVGTIVDDDVPSLSISDATVSEGDTGTVDAQFTVTLSMAAVATVTVDYATADVTATAGSDYTAVGTTTLTFDPGETSKSVTVTVLGDVVDELDETFVVNLTNATNATIADAQGVGTINDDEGLTIGIDDVTVLEGDSGTVGAQFTVSLSTPSAVTVTVDYATAEVTATAGSDYTAVGVTTLTFAPGETSKSFAVSVIGDVVDETDETFSVSLTNATNASIADASGTGTITDDDSAELSINDVTVTEGDSGTVQAQFTVSLSTPSATPVTVDVATADGTATAGSDYTAVGTTTLTFAPGETLKSVTVSVLGDRVDETDETFTVNLTNATNASIADASGIGTITDDDSAGLSINDATVVEGDSGSAQAQFTVSLSTPSVVTVTVDYATADGTATAGSDYAAVGTTTLTFNPGETSRVVTILVSGDTDDESEETFVVNLTNATNATIVDAQGVGTIANDDDPVLAIDDVSVTEGDSGTTNAVFTVSLSPASADTVTVSYATANVTATAGSDYTAVGTTTLTFAPGETWKAVTVVVMGDVDDEPDETFVVNLFNAANADIGHSHGTGTIEDDDGCEMQTWYRDVDQDRYGVDTDTIESCTQPDGYAADSGDCVDTDATIHPGAIEVLDGKDNDCNGQIDDVSGPIGTPTWVTATAVTSTSVGVNWVGVSGAVSYQVFRRSAGTSYALIGTSLTAAYTDPTALSGTAYLYAVKAVDGLDGVSGLSNPDLATTVMFTDPTITTGVTKAKAAHMTELRTAVDAVRQLAGLSAASWTDPTLTAGTTKAKAVHVTQLRTALEEARATLGFSALSYTDATITTGVTSMKAAHVTELRTGVQ